jgi:hypothetical protein
MYYIAKLLRQLLVPTYLGTYPKQATHCTPYFVPAYGMHGRGAPHSTLRCAAVAVCF